MSRVLLINPFYPLSETPSPPLGLAYLAGTLEAAGVAVQLLDAVVSPLSVAALRAQMEDFAPQWGGVTAVTMTVEGALEIVRQVKAIAPRGADSDGRTARHLYGRNDPGSGAATGRDRAR